MRCLINITCTILFCVTIISCGKKVVKSSESTSNLIYFNSFESGRDISSWPAITQQMLVEDPAPGDGKRSLHISGGCVQPTASINLPVHAKGGHYVLSCWAKTEDINQAGRIILTINGRDEQKEKPEVLVNDTEWRFYKSKKSQYWSPNHKLRLEIRIGGLISAHMFVDCIKIIETP